MRRETIISTISKLQTDIISTGVDEMLNTAIERFRQGRSVKEDSSGFMSFSTFQKYAVAISTYTDIERDIAKILDIDSLFSPETWEALASPSLEPSFIFGLNKNVSFAKDQLPKILKLFRQEHVYEVKNNQNIPRDLEGKTLITFILPEESHEYSSPARLISALDSISVIYSVYCDLENLSSGDLIVLACDSGSDKSFDFLGLAKIMEEVRKFVFALWDRRIFYRHTHVSQCINLIAESLPVIERIHALKKSGALAPEEAEILKRKAIAGATSFLESGIYINDMVAEGINSPRLLMRPEPKLLAAPNLVKNSQEELNATIEEKGTSDQKDKSSLSPEEQAVLAHLLAKTKSSTTPAIEAKKPRSKRVSPRTSAITNQNENEK